MEERDAARNDGGYSLFRLDDWIGKAGLLVCVCVCVCVCMCVSDLYARLCVL